MITTRIAALVLAAALTLTGCGGDAADEPAALQTAVNGDVFNGADVDFATRMIPHHAQAIQMVVLTRGRPLDSEVERLAIAIRDAQVPEVQTMVGWLTAWGEQIPETSLDHSNAGHDSDGHLEGLEELSEASDEEFQELWLRAMIEQHEGAVDMARDEQEGGTYRPALKLAASIERAQERQIEQMEELLG